MWYFNSPHIVYGEEALDFLSKIKGNKCFIVTDKVIEDLGYLKILTDKLDGLEKQYETFNDVVPDPREEGILKAKELCVAYKPDLIIALGGGSVIDTAKTLWVLYEFPEFEIDDVHAFRDDLYDLGKKTKFIAIPTTSGTGSETTFISVVSRFERDIWKKFFFLHRGMVPTYAIVDPIFPMGMPPRLTADSAFDALAHAIEAVGSLWRNEFSYALALKAIELIFEYLPIAYHDGNNIKARDFLHQAASLAGLAISNGQAHIGHTLGHTWGSLFHVPHGRAVGIALPYVTQYVMNNDDPEDKTVDLLAKVAKQLGWAKWEDDTKQSAYKVIDKVKNLQKEVDFPSKYEETDISKEDFEKNLDLLVSLCFEDSSSVLSSRQVGGEEFKKLFRYAYEGKDIDF